MKNSPPKSSNFQIDSFSNQFSSPQRQSEIGIALIFFSTLYKAVRGFWAVGAYFLIMGPSGRTLFFVLLGMGLLLVLALVYSYVYYRKFTYHINYEKEVFVLQKGVFSTENTEISFDKIQQVNTEQSLLQRLGNVYKLVIDTAGGKEKEASISALSKTKAERLSAILMRAKETSETTDEIDSEAVSTKHEKVVWSYKMDIATLLKIGISSNYFRGLAIIIAFVSTLYQEFSRWFQDSSALNEYSDQFSGLSKSVSGILLLVVLMLLASIAITMIEVFIKYFNLKLVQTQHRLQVEMGLKTNKKISLQPRRVQLFESTTNPIQKKLNLNMLKISLANSENALQKSKIKIPGLGKDLVEKVDAFLYENKASGFNSLFRPGRILLLNRLFFSSLPLVFFIVFWFFFPLIDWYLLLILSGIYLSIVGVWQLLYFKSLQLEISENFIQKKHGVWNKQQEKIETYKLQAVTVVEPYYYRKRNLVNLVFHTAGGDLSFLAANRKILPYLNFALFKIESAEEDWM